MLILIKTNQEMITVDSDIRPYETYALPIELPKRLVVESVHRTTQCVRVMPKAAFSTRQDSSEKNLPRFHISQFTFSISIVQKTLFLSAFSVKRNRNCQFDCEKDLF
jgi:hypothetical protein